MHQLVVATLNEGKLNEIRELLKDVPLELFGQADLDIGPVEETGKTFVENAIIKARHAAEKSGSFVIADDSGLLVEALGGAPGVYTSRFGGVNELLEAMEGVDNREATFYCVIVFMMGPDDPAPVICEGVWSGEILHKPQGDNGFGFDPVFYLPEQECSAAELLPELKNELSHRGQALAQLKNFLDYLTQQEIQYRQ